MSEHKVASMDTSAMHRAGNNTAAMVGSRNIKDVYLDLNQWSRHGWPGKLAHA
jgi:hypothetical protein